MISSASDNLFRTPQLRNVNPADRNTIYQLPCIRENIDELIDQERFEWFPEIEDGASKWYTAIRRLSKKINTQRNEIWDCQGKLRAEVDKNREALMILKNERREHREIVSALTAKIERLELELRRRDGGDSMAGNIEKMLESPKTVVPQSAESEKESLNSQVSELKTQLAKLTEKLSNIKSTPRSDDDELREVPKRQPAVVDQAQTTQMTEMKAQVEILRNENSQLKQRYDELKLLLMQGLRPTSQLSSVGSPTEVPSLSPELTDSDLELDSTTSDIDTPHPQQMSTFHHSPAASCVDPSTSTPSLRGNRSNISETSNLNIQRLDNLHKKLRQEAISKDELAHYEDIYKQSLQAFAERPRLEENTKSLVQDLIRNSTRRHLSILNKINNRLPA